MTDLVRDTSDGAVVEHEVVAGFVARPGALPSSLAGASSINLDSFDFFTGNVTAQMMVWDFFTTWNRHQAAKRSAEGQAAQTRSL